TRTIPQREVYSALQADMRSLMSNIQTAEQLADIRERLEHIRSGFISLADVLAKIQDPPTITRKGRPSTQRLTGPTEGRARGGGANIQEPNHSQVRAKLQNRCSLCHKLGHNRRSC
ncbi:hypothetical protein K438DRAFT_1515312, partial [Mycena galopus ATCC 62051]